MKVYQLNGIEYYCVAFSKGDALILFWANKIGVTLENIVETDIEPDRDAIGKVFRSKEELESFSMCGDFDF